MSSVSLQHSLTPALLLTFSLSHLLTLYTVITRNAPQRNNNSSTKRQKATLRNQ